MHPLVNVTVLAIRLTLEPQVVNTNPVRLLPLATPSNACRTLVTHPMVVPTSLLGLRLPFGGIFTVCVAVGTSRTSFPVLVYDMIPGPKPDLAQVNEVNRC